MKQVAEDSNDSALNHQFQGGYGQNKVYFYVCQEKSTVRNITIKHEFGGETTLHGSYTLEELASPKMNRAQEASAISRRLEFERQRLPNQGVKMNLPW